MQIKGISKVKIKVKVKVKAKFTLEEATKAQRALDGGGWSTPRTGRSTTGKDPVPIV
jgi:hypothetical protein